MKFTKGQVNRLGVSIAEKGIYIDNNELNLLQNFRTSFINSLKRVFIKVNDIAIETYPSCIVAFRLKRISTIINKVERNPKMSLSRMGDIAGIRCIFNTQHEVYSALKSITEIYDINGRIRDYYIETKELGYKGVHVYVIDPIDKNRVEIQLRTFKDHNWATLIEITDFLYGTRLKEIGYNDHPEFGRFHTLLSSDKYLEEEEASFIYKILKKYNFISQLNSTFLKNYEELKSVWQDEGRDKSFFLIEASKGTTPILKAFKNYDEAEAVYFERYKRNIEAQVVLTSIKKPNFKQLSIAYANYILSYHNFINDVQPILKELAIEALEDRMYFKFRSIFKTYEDIQAGVLIDVFSESAEISLNSKFSAMSKLERKRMLKNITDKVRKINKYHNEFINKLREVFPNNLVLGYLLEKFISRHSKRTFRKINEKVNRYVNEVNKQ